MVIFPALILGNNSTTVYVGAHCACSPNVLTRLFSSVIVRGNDRGLLATTYSKLFWWWLKSCPVVVISLTKLILLYVFCSSGLCRCDVHNLFCSCIIIINTKNISAFFKYIFK